MAIGNIYFTQSGCREDGFERNVNKAPQGKISKVHFCEFFLLLSLSPREMRNFRINKRFNGNIHQLKLSYTSEQQGVFQLCFSIFSIV